MRTSVIWHVGCELCMWSDQSGRTRVEAVALGRAHSEEKHADEYGFRVQKVRR